MTETPGSDPLVEGVDDVLITAELASRPSRNPDFEAENRALTLLAHEMATNPRGVLQSCAELVMKLCHADSAGVSILEPGGTSGMLRWHAAGGAFAPNLHGTMPREASPCGTVMERDRVLLFHEAERFFPALRGVEPRIYENLLAPWHVKGKPVGTLWAIKHAPEGRFDAEDARVLQSLARFASAAFQMISALDDVTAERTKLEQLTKALGESEVQQAFLLKLSDTLRVTPADAIIACASEMLADELRLDLCYVVTVVPDENRADVVHQLCRRTDMSRVPAVIRLSDYPQAFVEWQERTLVSDDMANDPALTETDRRNVAAMGFGALIAAPVRRGVGNPIWSIVAVMAQSRRWTAREIALVEETAERTWAAVERARTEQALRESEERFQQFAAASAAGLWIRQADSLEMEFASPATATIYGVEPDALIGDVRPWAALLVPEDRDDAFAHLEAARSGEATTHEFRIQRPSDGAFRWIRNTVFPLENADDRVQRIGGIAEDITEAKLAVEHQGVLLAELQHRVRNIMGMIRSMALRTAEGAADVEEYRSLLEDRLLALARVQALLTREANAGGSLREIVVSEVSAQAHRDDQFALDGPDIRLSPKAVEVLTLAIHELATNAVKYGAFSHPDGRLRVSWRPFEKRGRAWLVLDWMETGAPPREPSKRRGFGSDLIEGRIPYELGGTGIMNLQPDGAYCRMEFPLNDSGSILETDAPAPVTVFGGTLDMTNAPDLTGRKVLVVEDDYYIAGDTAAALRGAGAEVLGPCPSEGATLDLLVSKTPTHAVLDLNLGGGGPKFEIARILKERGVPFLFMTGYDADMIPAYLTDVPRLQKPVPFRQIVEAVSQL